MSQAEIEHGWYSPSQAEIAGTITHFAQDGVTRVVVTEVTTTREPGGAPPPPTGTWTDYEYRGILGGFIESTKEHMGSPYRKSGAFGR